MVMRTGGYDIPDVSRRCHASGRELQPGEQVYSVVLESITGMVRRDYAAEYWTGPPEGALAFWRGTIPDPDLPPSRREIPPAEMLEWLDRLDDPLDPPKLHLRYALGLLLLRRRILKLRGLERQGEDEYLVLGLPRGQGAGSPRGQGEFRILDPHPSEERIGQVEQELDQLLAGASTPVEEGD